MAKKIKESDNNKEKNYYDLKVDAIDKLVNAENAPEYSEEELAKYRSRGLNAVPLWIKVAFIKFWFNGAGCYFFFWGLGNYLVSFDILVAIAIGLGLINDLLVNNVLRFIEKEKGENDRWIMVTERAFWSLFVNVLYSGIILYLIVQTYTAINMGLAGDSNSEDIYLGVGPLLFGFLYMLYDSIFVFMKNTLIKIVKDANKKAAGKDK